jgi:hypothetical protein
MESRSFSQQIESQRAETKKARMRRIGFSVVKEVCVLAVLYLTIPLALSAIFKRRVEWTRNDDPC